MNQAEAKNDAPLMTNAMSRPASAVTSPPTDAPIASIAAQVALDSALAGISSSLLVTLGIVAVRAGSKNAEPVTESAITTYASQTCSRVRTSSRPSTTTPRIRSVAIISRRRSTRSTTTPASGPTTAIGMNWTIIIHATAVAEPVRSSSRAKTATELNQSPSCEIV